MPNLVKKRLLHTWIALLAMLFSALAPAFAQAFAPSRAAYPALEICTMNGMQAVAPDSAGDPAGAAGMGAIDHLLQHCSSCVTHGHGAALPPPAPRTFAPLVPAERHPILFYRAARAPFPWTAALSRAPPAAV